MTNILFSLMVIAASHELITENGLSILHQLDETDEYHLSDKNTLIYKVKNESCCDSEKERSR